MNYLGISKEEFKIKATAFLKYTSETFLSNVFVNTVIFSYHNEKLNILLLKFADTPYLMLPGDSIMKDEDIDAAAYRSLQTRVGLENIYLEQFYTLGKSKRVIEDVVADFLKEIDQKEFTEWFTKRAISICYYALVDEDKLKPVTKDLLVSEYKWVDVLELPKLLFDHNYIIEKAIKKLQDDLDKNLVVIGKNLMIETFTMGELQKLYEAVFQQTFTRTNFQRKMLGLNILERLEKKYNGKSHKAPYLYKFNTGTPAKNLSADPTEVLTH